MSKGELVPVKTRKDWAKIRSKRKPKLPEIEPIRKKIDIIRGGYDPDMRDERDNMQKLRAFERDRRVSEEIIESMSKYGTFYRDGELTYYLEHGTRQLIDISKGGLDLETALNRYGLNPTEKIFKYVAAELYLHAINKGKETTVHHFSHLHLPDDGKSVLYIATEENRVWKITTDSIDLTDNGMDGFLFVSSKYSAPKDIPQDSIRATGLINSLIIGKVPFSTDRLTREESEFLLLCQAFVLLMRELVTDTRPIYALIGEKGSGKTTAVRSIGQTIYGPEWDVTDVTQNVRDFDTLITTDSFVCFDNADENIKWFNNKLAIIGSGGRISRNQLYKTHHQVDYPIISMVAVTSRTPCFHRDDVVDRLVILRTLRLEGSDQGDFKSDIRKSVRDNRERLWGELIYQCQSILQVLDKNDWRSIKVPRERLQEFARFTVIVGKALRCEELAYKVWQSMKVIQDEFINEGEVLFEVLPSWIEKNAGREITSNELNPELSQIAKQNGIRWPYHSGQSLGQKLSHLKAIISKSYNFTKRDCPKRKLALYSFSLKGLPESKSIPDDSGNDSGPRNPHQ